MTHLLDTNICSAHMRHPAGLAHRFFQYAGSPSGQPIGWNPDLNAGVRLNIPPFMTAGILRKNRNITWTKDRGKEPERDKEEYPWFWDGKEFVGDCVNDVHLTIAEKRARSRSGFPA